MEDVRIGSSDPEKQSKTLKSIFKVILLCGHSVMCPNICSSLINNYLMQCLIYCSFH